MSYDINGANQVKAVRNGQSGASYYLQQAAYKPDGSFAGATFGLDGLNQWTETRDYNSRLQARNARIQKGGQTLLGLNWVYSASYNVDYEETGTDNNGTLRTEVLQYPSGGQPQTVPRTYSRPSRGPTVTTALTG